VSPALLAAIDTGALLALASPNDQHHEEAVRIARAWVRRGGRWVGTTLVLAELHGHLLGHLDPAGARRLLRAVTEDPVYEWQDVGVEAVQAAASEWLERYPDQRFSLTDAVTFDLMRREKIRAAFAFDADFVTAGFERLTDRGDGPGAEAGR